MWRITRLHRGPAVELRPRLRWGHAFLNRNHNLFSGLEIKSKSMIKSKKISLEMGFHKSQESRSYPILTGLVHE